MSAYVEIAGDVARVSFTFSRELVEQLKARIPGPYRRFDPDTKAWIVLQPWVATAIAAAYEVFGPDEVIIEERKRTHAWTAPTSSRGDSYGVLHLLPSAPAQLVDAAYKTLARLHHPDTGGDTATMQRLNEAYSEIRKQLAS